MAAPVEGWEEMAVAFIMRFLSRRGMVERITLDGALELELPDGAVVRVQPGPYKKGISVVPIQHGTGAPAGNGKRGRKPRPGTVKLRAKLAKDAKGNKVRPAKDYVKWLLSEDPEISLSVARQVVYRERRAVLE